MSGETLRALFRQTLIDAGFHAYLKPHECQAEIWIGHSIVALFHSGCDLALHRVMKREWDRRTYGVTIYEEVPSDEDMDRIYWAELSHGPFQKLHIWPGRPAPVRFVPRAEQVGTVFGVVVHDSRCYAGLVPSLLPVNNPRLVHLTGSDIERVTQMDEIRAQALEGQSSIVLCASQSHCRLVGEIMVEAKVPYGTRHLIFMDGQTHLVHLNTSDSVGHYWVDPEFNSNQNDVR